MSGSRDPRSVIRELISGSLVSTMIVTAVRIGVADALAEGPMSLDALATLCEVREDPMRRFMAGLAAFGVFRENSEGIWELNDVGATLRRGGFGQASALYAGNEAIRNSWLALEYSLRSGDPSFPAVNNGLWYWDFQEHSPIEGRMFDRYLGQVHQRRSEAVGPALDVSDGDMIIDIGGGDGSICIEVLRRRPACRAVIFDTERLRGFAERAAAGCGLSDKIEFRSGDFFEEVPDGGDAYIMSQILHNWPDDLASDILRVAARAMPAAAFLHVIEVLRGEDWTDARELARLDMAMLTQFGGRQRSRADMERLLSGVGLTVTDVSGLAAPATIIKARKSG